LLRLIICGDFALEEPALVVLANLLCKAEPAVSRQLLVLQRPVVLLPSDNELEVASAKVLLAYHSERRRVSSTAATGIAAMDTSGSSSSALDELQRASAAEASAEQQEAEVEEEDEEQDEEEPPTVGFGRHLRRLPQTIFSSPSASSRSSNTGNSTSSSSESNFSVTGTEPDQVILALYSLLQPTLVTTTTAIARPASLVTRAFYVLCNWARATRANADALLACTGPTLALLQHLEHPSADVRLSVLRCLWALSAAYAPGSGGASSPREANEREQATKTKRIARLTALNFHLAVRRLLHRESSVEARDQCRMLSWAHSELLDSI
jgi:hypothetical protein